MKRGGESMKDTKRLQADDRQVSDQWTLRRCLLQKVDHQAANEKRGKDSRQRTRNCIYLFCSPSGYIALSVSLTDAT